MKMATPGWEQKESKSKVKNLTPQPPSLLEKEELESPSPLRGGVGEG